MTPNDDCLHAAAPPGFSFVEAVRQHQPGYGGVAVFYSSELRGRKVRFGDCSPEIETVAVRLTHWTNSHLNVLLLCIYRPPHLSWPNARQKLSQLMKKAVSTPSDHVVITGNINVHLDDPGDIQMSSVQHILTTNNLFQHITDQTHVEGHTVDVVITNTKVNITDIDVQPPSVSDHSLIVWSSTPASTTKKKPVRSEVCPSVCPSVCHTPVLYLNDNLFKTFLSI